MPNPPSLSQAQAQAGAQTVAETTGATARPITTFAIALIAGGASTRMGRDKARLPDRDGRELWKGRLELLLKTASSIPGWSREALISCRLDQDYPVAEGVRAVVDAWPCAGPLGGIVSCLEAMESDVLLVMAVDLPSMRAEILKMLLQAATESGPRGAVFARQGFFEPMAAVYPKSMAASGRRRLDAGQGAMKAWIKEAADRMTILDLPDEWLGAFRNVNDPVEWECWLKESAKDEEAADPD